MYGWLKDNQEKKTKYYGVIAQELQELAPDLVTEDRTENHYLAVNYTGLIPHLIKVHQMNRQQIEDLQHKIHSQDKIVEDLNQKLNKLSEVLGVSFN